MAPTTTETMLKFDVRCEKAANLLREIKVSRTASIAEAEKMAAGAFGFSAVKIRPPPGTPAKYVRDGYLRETVMAELLPVGKALLIDEVTTEGYGKTAPVDHAPGVAHRYTIADQKTSGTNTHQNVIMVLPPSESNLRPVVATAERNESAAGKQNLLMLSPEIALWLAQNGKLDLGGA